MLTNNCRSLFRALFCAGGRSTTKVTSTSGGTFTLKGATFAPFALGGTVYLDNPAGAYASDGDTRVYLGSGTTPAKKTDYCIETPLTVGATTYKWSSGLDDNGKVYALCTIAYTNTTTSAVKISEMGYAVGVAGSGGGAGLIFLDRTLLDSPITLSAGESCAIRYRITNQFTVQ